MKLTLTDPDGVVQGTYEIIDIDSSVSSPGDIQLTHVLRCKEDPRCAFQDVAHDIWAIHTQRMRAGLRT